MLVGEDNDGQMDDQDARREMCVECKSDDLKCMLYLTT